MGKKRLAGDEPFEWTVLRIMALEGLARLKLLARRLGHQAPAPEAGEGREGSCPAS